MVRTAPVVVCVLVPVAFVAMAQTAMSFRLDKSDRNPTSCAGGDAAMSRPQQVTISNDVAIIASNGGINDKAKMVKAGLYHTKWSAGGITYEIDINTTASPATMTVSEPKLGCKWTGNAS